jgi:hypothetical protein
MIKWIRISERFHLEKWSQHSNIWEKKREEVAKLEK